MGKRHAGVDRYIANAAAFARPILKHFRELVHKACPEAEETLKWSAPFFEYKGVLCGMAAFKEHCAFPFWKGELIIKGADRNAMGHLGRVTKLSELPPDKVLARYVQEAVRLNEQGIKAPRQIRSTTKKELAVPDYFMAALKKNKNALNTFENFSYSHKKEYVEWITEAKREETRASRMATALQWLSQGKARHWKYQ
jgi:uncharacterized protein YdeI (YjbR/CyaY-like superfamily)